MPPKPQLYTPLSQRNTQFKNNSAGGSLEDIKRGIAYVETRNAPDSYSIQGKPRPSDGKRALGKYQVFETNLPAWTKEALGREYSKDEFLADPQAQEKVADHFMGRSLQQYGNPEDVASVWFTGRPVAKANNAADYTGTDNATYQDLFKKGMGAVSTAAKYIPLAARKAGNTVLDAFDKSKIAEVPGKTVDGLRMIGGFLGGDAPAQNPIRIGGAEGFDYTPPNIDPTGAVGFTERVGTKVAKPVADAAFQGFEDLSTKLLEKLKGRSTVSKQFISDLTNSPDLKQAEKDLIRRLLDEGEQSGSWHHGTHNDFKGFDPDFDYENIPDSMGQIRDYEVPPGFVFLADNLDKAKVYGQKVASFDIDSKKILKIDAGENSPDRFFDDDYNGANSIFNKFYKGNYDAIEVTGKGREGTPTKILVAPPGVLKPASDQINVPDFANKVKSELLPLNTGAVEYPRYENINLSEDLRGPVAGYQERVYESPVSTSAGGVHFSNTGIKKEGGIYQPKNYFAHSRIEDLPDSNKSLKGLFQNEYPKGTTRRVIEIQSDLFQKGRLEGEMPSNPLAVEKAIADNARGNIRSYPEGSIPWKAETERLAEAEDRIKMLESGKNPPKIQARIDELSKLEPYRNTWHERVIREEVKQAAKDGKTKLQFPTGETAMKIEGLGTQNNWYRDPGLSDAQVNAMSIADVNRAFRNETLTPEALKVGETVRQGGAGGEWIITDVLGDGKFKAVPKDIADHLENMRVSDGKSGGYSKAHAEEQYERAKETFDISGKVDTENPIFRFYDKTVAKYLTNKYGGKVITDPQGVKWVEIDVKPEYKGLPVEAFGAAIGIPSIYQQVQEQKEQGNI